MTTLTDLEQTIEGINAEVEGLLQQRKNVLTEIAELKRRGEHYPLGTILQAPDSCFTVYLIKVSSVTSYRSVTDKHQDGAHWFVLFGDSSGEEYRTLADFQASHGGQDFIEIHVP